MPIRAVIFDVGGVLVHTVDRSRQRAWEQRLGLANGALEATIWSFPVSLQANVGLASRAAIWDEAARRFKLNADDTRLLEEDYFSGGVWNERLIEYARSLKLQHRTGTVYKTGIISNAWPDAREAIKAHVNETQFDDLIFSAEVGLAKPDRRIYALALERLQLPSAEAIFVDDVQENVEAAQAIGMQGLRFESTEQTIEMIEQYLNIF